MPKISVLYQEMVVETIFEVKSLEKCCPCGQVGAKYATRAKIDRFHMSADPSGNKLESCNLAQNTGICLYF